jgi:hypothetical protein
MEEATYGLHHDEIANGSMYNSGMDLGLGAMLDNSCSHMSNSRTTAALQSKHA